MKLLKYIILAAIPCMTVSCNYLEERSQDTYYIASYEDLDELLIGDCYLPVNDASDLTNTSDVGYFIHYLADEIDEQHGGQNSYDEDNRERIFGYYTWQQRVGETYNQSGYYTENGSWKETYRLINVANNIIECVDDVPQETEAEKAGALRVNGEAHFLRAAYYFWLVNLYGKPYSASTASTDLAVPIKTSAQVEDVIYRRNTVQEVYDLVLSDLKAAEEMLSQINATKSVYRADCTAVRFLLSKVYLYMQNWDMAIQYADKVLNAKSGLVDFNTLAGAPLAKNSVETLFSMGGVEIPCSMCNYYQSFRVSSDLYNAYADDDLRKSKYWWKRNDFIGYVKVASPSTKDVDVSSSSYYSTMYHYAMQGEKAEVSDRFLYRTAEAYLIKAEAEAYKGNESEARNYLNQLRLYRYKSGTQYEINASGKELVDAIREERRLELALEGARWFDLRRYSVCEKYPESKEITHYYTVYEDDWPHPVPTEHHQYVLKEYDAAYTLPIPQEVIDYNTGMPNNERPERTYTTIPID